MKVRIKLISQDGKNVLVTATVVQQRFLPEAIVMGDRAFVLESDHPSALDARFAYREVVAVSLPTTESIKGTPGAEIESWTEELLRF